MTTGSGAGRATTADHPLSATERARNLFEFLAHAQMLKTRPVRTIETYLRDGAVVWMNSFPDHPAVTATHRNAEPDPDQPVVAVERVPPSEPPPLPEGLFPWLDGDVADPSSELRLRKPAPDATAPPDDPDQQLALVDRPEIQERFDAWLPGWSSWADAERSARPVRRLYRQLFAIFMQLETHPEEFELVIGVGCLAWRPANHPDVCRHVLVTTATMAVDHTTSTITVSAREPVTVELDMLDPALVPISSQVNEVRARARVFEHHPVDRANAGDLVRRLVMSLDGEAQYDNEDDDVPGLTSAPRAAFAPAVIVRKRSGRGLVDIFASIAAEIADSGEVPAGVLPLVDPNHEPEAQQSPSEGALVTVDDEVFLPLPLNAAQLEVVRRVDREAQTLVQGPPGTGKTHTAAALLSHLLAQGKRVLVTAHTDRALKEVRAKLPEGIKPLAVAVVGTARDDMADLRVAVERLSGRASDHDAARAQVNIENCLATIDGLRRQRAGIRSELLAAREREVSSHQQGGYAGTLAAIAQAYQAEAEVHGWIAGLVAVQPDTPPPLDDAQSARWWELLNDRALAADEPESRYRLVEMAGLLTPQAFAAHVDAEIKGEQESAVHADISEHVAYQPIAALAVDVRSALQQRMREIARRAGELERRREPWMDAALYDIRAGRGATWSARDTLLHDLVTAARPLLERLGATTEVTIDAKADRGTIEALAEHLQRHVTANGPIKTLPDGSVKIGAFSAKPVKQARLLFDAVRVNGQPPTSQERLTALAIHLQVGRQLSALDKAWPAAVEKPSDGTQRERLEWHASELLQVGRLTALAHALQEADEQFAHLGLPRPDWNDMQSVLAYAQLVDATTAYDALAAATRPLQLLSESVETITRWEDAAPTVRQLANAVNQRDRDAYARAHGRLRRLHAVNAMVAERDSMTEQVRGAAPDLTSAVVGTPTAAHWADRLPRLPQAWAWAQIGGWILEQDTSDINVLQAQIGAVEARLRHTIEELAATRAWEHALSPQRLTGQSRADLTQYAQLVRRLGKGTGKYAATRRSEIRVAMERCRPNVPVWIMPIYRIADQLRVSQDMFDVVIVDEASQAGLEATFLQYLAPKIVVIGDDRQVSPSAVGVNQQELRDLANLYLPDDRYKASWLDPKRSLFDEANMRFGSKITLVEHRRCVPEIIGFSNRIAYEPDNVRLIPVRQYGSDRLEPIKVVHVPDGYERGSSGTKTNPAEVDAIVTQLEQCLSDPRYDGLTFGVISLQGTVQARMIEAALMERIPAEQWVARDLRCGGAADFQGSERDVVFLSMVSAPAPDQRMGSFTAESYVQRYNVAASRAKDQLWVFHSITLEQLPNSEDMRHQLLDYCYGVIARGSTTDAGHSSSVVSDDERVEPFDSLFEQRVYNRLVDRGHHVIPQFPENGYKLDLVVMGGRGRLAIECDGDAWHGPDAYQRDLARKRDLERCGWQFFSIRESAYYVNQHAVLQRLWDTLDELDIRPSGWVSPEDLDFGEVAGYAVDDEPDVVDVPRNRRSEPTVVAPEQPSVAAVMGLPAVVADEPAPVLDAALPRLRPYRAFDGATMPAITATAEARVASIREIVTAEGPVTGSRIHQAYVQGRGTQRISPRVARVLNSAITTAVRDGVLVADDPRGAAGVKSVTYRLPSQSVVSLRELGPRTLEQVPPLELAHLMREAAVVTGWDSQEALFLECLKRLGRDRLTDAGVKVFNAALVLAKEDP